MIKLTSWWQMLAVLALCFAAIIAAYVFAPPAVTLVVGMATAIFALVTQKHDGDPPNPTGSPPDLTVLKGGLATLTLCLLTFACGPVHDAAKPTSYGVELAACEQASHSWAEYTPCCVDVAKRYSRNPEFCSP